MLWRIYKGFFVGLLLTLGACAIIFTLVFSREWEERFKASAHNHLIAVRDMIGGLIADGLPPDRLLERVRPMLEENRARVVIFSHGGNTIYTFESRKLDNHEPIAWNAEIAAQAIAEGVFIGLPRRGQPLIAAMPIAIPHDDHALLVASVRAPSWLRSKALPRLGIALFVLLIGGFIVSFLVARTLARPLTALTHTVERFGAGELDARAQVWGHDELALLAGGFNRMANRLTRLLEDKRRFLGDVSHELKTPLSRLRLCLALAREGAAPESEEFLSKADAQVEALAVLIDELAFFSRLEAAPYAAECRAHDISALVRTELDDFGAAHFNIQLQAAKVPTDRRLFERALGNVLKNALKYAPQGSPIDILGRTDGDHYLIDIDDAGPGVAPAERERIFEPFYRTDAARTRDTGGTGLGLAIAKRCVEAHHGGITAEASPQGGLRVRIRFPLA